MVNSPRFSFIQFDNPQEGNIALPVNVLSDLSFFVYCDFKFQIGIKSKHGVMPFSEVHDGFGNWIDLDGNLDGFKCGDCFTLVILQNNAVVAESNNLYYLCDTKYTSVVQYELYESGFEWECPVGINRVRLPLYLSAPQFPQENEDYKMKSGLRRKMFAEIEKSYSLNTDYLPEDLHQKLLIALSNDEVYIDDELLTKSDTYNIDWSNTETIDEIKLAMASCRMVENVTFRNDNCGECEPIVSNCTVEWFDTDAVCQVEESIVEEVLFELAGLTGAAGTYTSPSPIEVEQIRDKTVNIEFLFRGQKFTFENALLAATFYGSYYWETYLEPNYGLQIELTPAQGQWLSGLLINPLQHATPDLFLDIKISQSTTQEKQTGNSLRHKGEYKMYRNGTLVETIPLDLLLAFGRLPEITLQEWSSYSDNAALSRALGSIYSLNPCADLEQINTVINEGACLKTKFQFIYQIDQPLDNISAQSVWANLRNSSGSYQVPVEIYHIPNVAGASGSYPSSPMEGFIENLVGENLYFQINNITDGGGHGSLFPEFIQNDNANLKASINGVEKPMPLAGWLANIGQNVAKGDEIIITLTTTKKEAIPEATTIEFVQGTVPEFKFSMYANQQTQQVVVSGGSSTIVNITAPTHVVCENFTDLSDNPILVQGLPQYGVANFVNNPDGSGFEFDVPVGSTPSIVVNVFENK